MRQTKRTLRAMLGMVASALLLSGCSTMAPDATATPVSFKVCVLTGGSGFGDHSINDSIYQGVLQTQAAHGVKVMARTVNQDSTVEAVTSAAKRILKQDCSAMVVSGEVAASVESIAANYPTVNFLIVKGVPYVLGADSGRDPIKLTNVKVISFDSAQAGFMAGYLAATQSKTFRVGAFGSSLNETEIALLAGFHQGVGHYNFTRGGAVGVVGLSSSATDSWVSATPGSRRSVATVAAKMMAEDADVLFPVVGDTSAKGAALGAVDAMVGETPVEGVTIIGSVSDWYDFDSAKSARPAILASALLSVQLQVAAALTTMVDATFTGGTIATYVGTLANGGVTLTGEKQVSYSSGFVNTESEIRSQIASGQIVVKSKLGG